ncbi:hypothetical protein [Cryobacterium fucosi]|uniref:Uncharacterized protein n=1 Tax=Cryobacterium fucosi TaxID=1259157 RepID=A0A4R9BAZ7_9MICO|nr:hypothetical protein [Cryobacterium fucosi]TFD79662.1 hypothetical protein E3T48_05595 [Cryobacterium fucosi]
MGFLDRLLGRDEPERPAGRQTTPKRTDDEIAVERYEYLLRTAPPETIEQVHTEAFGKLTEEQRDLLFRRLSENADASERPANAEPATLAQAATRQEIRQPGTLARSFGGQGQGGLGFGGMVGSTILGTVAGYVIGSALMSTFLPGDSGGTDAGGDTSGADTASSGGDFGGSSGGDFGGGSGGDFGGGDFGGF